MTDLYYEIRLCHSCGLRYPLTNGHPLGVRCPSCLGETRLVLKSTIPPLTSRESVGEAPAKGTRGKSNVFALLDNIRSAWNVGSIFRTADGLGVSKLYLCGITPTPENESVRKTALGAENLIDWEYSRNAVEIAKKLKQDGHVLWALENDPRAIAITGVQSPALDSQFPILILGNEVTGIDPEILDMCDQIIHIPMHGQKRSFNVEVAFAIAVFALRSQMA